MLNTERIIKLDNDGDRHDDRKFLKRMEKLTSLSSHSFQYLIVSNYLNITSNYRRGMAKGKGLCDNCGVQHYFPDCPHLHEEAKIKKAKKERTARRGGGGCNGGRGGGRQGERNICSNDNRDGNINYY